MTGLRIRDLVMSL